MATDEVVVGEVIEDDFAPPEIGPIELLAGAIVSNGGALSVTVASLQNKLAYEGKVIQIDFLEEKAALVLTLGEDNGNQG